MHLSAETIARQLGAATKSGNNWSCRCPAHDDKRASLSIAEKDDGKLLVHCHAGCDQSLVINELKAHGLWPSAKPAPESLPPPVQISIGAGKGKIAATYDYVNADGELLYQAVRYEPKDFRQRKPNPDGTWNWSIKGVERVLYRLPEVLAAVADGKTIYICEGEKDVEAARSIGLVATCNAMGADNGSGNKWLPAFGKILMGADVVVVPDQDDPGIRHAEWVISTLQNQARSVKVVIPASGKDLSDWLDAGATVDDIEACAVDAFEVEASNDISIVLDKKNQPLFVDAYDLIQNLKPIEWLIEDYVETDSLSLLFSPPSSGKSFVMVDMACCVATGTPWHGRSVKRGPVFYIAGEGHNGMARRLAAWSKHNDVSLKDVGLYKSQRSVSLYNEDAAKDLCQVIGEMSQAYGVLPAMVVIDTVARNFGEGDENSTEDMSRFINHIDTYLRLPFGSNVFLAHHAGHNMDRARGSSALKAALDSEYQVVKDGAVVQFIPTKMKDAELPPELTFRLSTVDLGEINGQQINSAVLLPQDDVLDFKVGTDSAGEAIKAKDVVEFIQRGWVPLSDLKDSFKCTKTTMQRAIGRCTERGLLVKDGQGYKVTEKAIGALSLTGRQILKLDVPVYKRGE